MRKLTQKQRRFADEYLVDCNGTKAAVRAGYSPKTANEQAAKLMANPKIHSYITEKLDEISSKKIADAQETMEYLTAVMRGEHKEQILRLNGNGVQVLDYMETPAAIRLKAAEMLAKRYGLLKENFEIESVSPVVIVNDLKE